MRGCKHGQRMGGGVARHTKAQAEQTREAILDAAEKVFYERGVARSTLEEVARVAGVSVAMAADNYDLVLGASSIIRAALR